TKSPGKGTGLGLSQVYGVIRQIGGDVTIDTEVGKGTRICMTLPIASKTSADDQGETGAMAHGWETTLMVDDDADVRQIMVSVLSELGYQIREADTGEVALALLKDY